jgi:hypothetical protein
MKTLLEMIDIDEADVGKKYGKSDLAVESGTLRKMISMVASDKAGKFVHGEEVKNYVSPELFDIYKKLNILINNPSKLE